MHQTLAGPLIAIVIALPFSAATAENTAQDEAAIRRIVESYVAAFNRAEVKAVAACWADDGRLVTTSGEVLEGREIIEAAFGDYFSENKGAKLDVSITSITVDSPDSAVERGVSHVTGSDGTVHETTYAAHYKRQDGKWKLTDFREAEAAPSHYEQLKELEWIIGDWVDADENSTIRTSFRWTKNNNFITRSFVVSAGDLVEMEGTQIIGWAPDKKVIRSWLFDSHGGTGVGVWSRQDNRWTIHNVRILPDGQKGSSVNVITRIDDDSFTWKSTSREVDGGMLPSIGPVTVTRVTGDE